jgi:hypothetical protein
MRLEEREKRHLSPRYILMVMAVVREEREE